MINALTRARSFIDKGWTQFVDARDAHDIPVSYKSITACKWCAVGALHKANQPLQKIDYHRERFWILCNLLESNMDPRIDKKCLHVWNDLSTTNKNDVIALFDKTIQKLENQHAYC